MESIDIITYQEDFENIDEYKKLDKKDKDYIWKYAKDKLVDILMQDYDLCLESCVQCALDWKIIEESRL
tara:strand:- start:162 stop:368 length:207 start_codon:yes stop_codon:yes gene_type:complete